MLIQLAVCAVLVPGALLRRRQFRRATHRTQWLLSALTWLAVGSLSTLIVVFFNG
jgi:hypothetical protein